MRWFSMNEFVVLNRFREVCPVANVSDLSSDSLKKACHIAFKIIGFEPSDFDGSLERANRYSKSQDLCDFIWDVWRIDNDLVRFHKGRIFCAKS